MGVKLRNVRFLCSCVLFCAALASQAKVVKAQKSETQNVLAPGLYMFQMRVRHATCGDAERTGEISSFLVSADGKPGAREMSFRMPNNKYWPKWKVVITSENLIVADADLVGGPGHSHFELKENRRKKQFQGTGLRNYKSVVDGKKQDCRISYDALIKSLTL